MLPAAMLCRLGLQILSSIRLRQSCLVLALAIPACSRSHMIPQLGWMRLLCPSRTVMMIGWFAMAQQLRAKTGCWSCKMAGPRKVMRNSHRVFDPRPLPPRLQVPGTGSRGKRSGFGKTASGYQARRYRFCMLLLPIRLRSQEKYGAESMCGSATSCGQNQTR